MSNAYDRLDAWIDAHFDEEVRFLQALVRCPPTRRPATTRRMPSAPPSCWPAWASRPRSTRCRRRRCKAYGLQSITNLIVRRRFGAGGPIIALNAHGDVVPPGEGWTHDPYGGEIVDGKLYGRASAVSKSDFATYTFALRALESLGAPLQGRRRTALHLRRGIRRRARPGLAAANSGLTKPDSCWPPASATRWSPRTTAACRWRSRCTARWPHAAYPTPASTRCRARSRS